MLEIKDAVGSIYDLLNVVDYGITFEQYFIVHKGTTNGTPSSSAWLGAFGKGWSRRSVGQSFLLQTAAFITEESSVRGFRRRALDQACRIGEPKQIG